MRTTPIHAAVITSSLKNARHRPEIAVVINRSKVSLRRGRELALAGYSGIPSLGGGAPDVALISAALSGASLCVACISRKTNVPEPRAEAILVTLGRALALRRRLMRCGACQGTKRIFRLG